VESSPQKGQVNGTKKKNRTRNLLEKPEAPQRPVARITSEETGGHRSGTQPLSKSRKRFLGKRRKDFLKKKKDEKRRASNGVISHLADC